MPRFARVFLCVALFLLASPVTRANASTSFPPTIAAELGLISPPPCTLCHRSDLGGLGTVVTPFGRTMMNHLGVSATNVSSLKTALLADRAQNLDSDGDGISDIDELQAGMDPNVGASGEVAGPDVPLPETGCSFVGRPASRGSFVFALACLGLALARRRPRRVRSTLRVAALSGSSLVALAGCSLDARQLRFDSAGGQGGAVSLPLLSAGVGGSTAGAPLLEDAAAAPADCPDLDGNGIADCAETLLQNGDFKLDVAGWIADPQSKVAWDEMNAAADLPSGSALLTAADAASPSASGQRVAKQCLALSGKQLVTVFANAFTHEDQGAGGRAQIDVFFFDSAGCAGSSVNNFSTPQPLDASPDAWLTLKAGSVSADSTRSVLVALTTLQEPSDTSFSARFDNVLLKKQPL